MVLSSSKAIARRIKAFILKEFLNNKHEAEKNCKNSTPKLKTFKKAFMDIKKKTLRGENMEKIEQKDYNKTHTVYPGKLTQTG